jgi:hypothetical protein
VAVVGTGGSKNQKQQKTGTHWARIYASGCQQAACFEASRDSEAKQFGALICDFKEDENRANCRFEVSTNEELLLFLSVYR